MPTRRPGQRELSDRAGFAATAQRLPSASRVAVSLLTAGGGDPDSSAAILVTVDQFRVVAAAPLEDHIAALQVRRHVQATNAALSRSIVTRAWPATFIANATCLTVGSFPVLPP